MVKITQQYSLKLVQIAVADVIRVQTEKSKSNSSTFQGPFKDPLTKFKDPIGVVFKFRFEFTLIL